MIGVRVTALALRKRIHLARLNERLPEIIERCGGSLCAPEVVAMSKKMDKLVLEIMDLEGVAVE